MVLNAAVQMLREADDLKQSILKFKSDTSMLQERCLWSLQQQLQKIYQKVLVLDLDYALDKKVEQDLWNVGFKQQIEALQAISKDRKNPLRSEGQAMLSWVLQAAGGFYLSLLHQICTTFKLDLPFRRRASLLGWVEGWSPSATGGSPRLPPPAAARYICQHCLVHLGDLARYRQQPRVAYTFYRHALVVSPHSGQPYNQLALLARRRGRRLGALYWHVRALLVRAPFPPARANLARTLQALAGHVPQDTPVIRGPRKQTAAVTPPPLPRLDAHAYVTELMRALHAVHTAESLDFAEQLVETLNTSLTSLVATDCFESMTLTKMMCVLIWLVHSTTDDLTSSETALSESEATAAELSQSLAAGALLALLLPSHTAESPPRRALPALKVCLQWATLYPQLLESAPFQSRPQIWHALAHTLNKLAAGSCDQCKSVPLPEDEELHGFQPLEQSFEDLKFSNHATWDTYGRSVPDIEDETPTDQDIPPPSVVSPACFGDPELEANVRAHRLIKLGMRLAELRPEQFAYNTEEAAPTFTALCRGGEQLSRCVAALRQARPVHGLDEELDSEDDAPLPPPVVISEADFREKVRDKRVGILKPQGSLERSRVERAMANAEDQDSEECVEGFREDRKETRRPRVNIAMAAILRKQEESCKQVKFRTPPPVAEDADAEAAADSTPILEPSPDRPKTIQTKPQKPLSQIRVGRKTGGILALKDKSGYPHLVNIPLETMVRKEEKPSPQKDPKVIQPPIQKQRDQGKWQQLQSFEQTNLNIRLSVVNPKEIDVRSAALQKHRSPNYSLTSDKKQFLNDLPPRFANQRWNQENKFRDEDFRMGMSANLLSTPPPNWLSAMPPPLQQLPSQLSSLHSQLNSQLSLATQMGMSSQIGSQRSPQMSGQLPGQMSLPTSQMTQYPPPALTEPYLPPWWKASPTFNVPTSTASLQQSFYSPQMPSVTCPSYSQMTQIQGNPETVVSPHGFVRQSTIGQMPSSHISPLNFNPLGFGYPNMFDQFNKPPQYQARGFLDEGYQTSSLNLGRHIGLDLASSPPPMDAYEPGYERRMNESVLERAMDTLETTPSPLDLSKPREEGAGRESPPEDPGTYSLFSGAPGAVSWGNVTHNQQSLWSEPPRPAPAPTARRQ